MGLSGASGVTACNGCHKPDIGYAGFINVVQHEEL